MVQRCSSVVECLVLCEVLGSIPGTIKTEKKQLNKCLLSSVSELQGLLGK